MSASHRSSSTRAAPATKVVVVGYPREFESSNLGSTVLLVARVASHHVMTRANRTLEERAVGGSFGAGWQRLRTALVAGGGIDAATVKLVIDFRWGRLLVGTPADICELDGGSLRFHQACQTCFGVPDAEAEAVKAEMVATTPPS